MTDRDSLPPKTFPPEIEAMMGVYALYWKLEEVIAAEVAETGLSRPEAHMLIKLGTPMRMGVLAREMLALPSTITATADSLERAGNLTRSRDPDDRRAWLLELTPEGRALRAEFVADAGALFHEVSGLDACETEEFARLARKIRLTILETGLSEGFKT